MTKIMRRDPTGMESSSWKGNERMSGYMRSKWNTYGQTLYECKEMLGGYWSKCWQRNCATSWRR